MSSILQLTNTFKSFKMSSQMNTFAQPLKENMNPLYKNLYLYVPRASLRTTEDQVKDLLFRSQIGNVEYCDLVTIKDKDTKQPLYTQLFIKLSCWNLMSRAKADFERNGSIKIYLSDPECWIILPNKNPLPRTHVNTSQLAASTEKLFVQTESIEKRMDSFEDEMRAEMAEMRAFMKLQQQSIDALKTELSSANLDIEQLREENSQLTYQLSGYHMAIYGNKTVDENELAEAAEEDENLDQFDMEIDELLDLPVMLPTISRTASIAVEDGLQIPQLVRCHSVLQSVDEDACIFSLNKIPRSLSPVPILSSRTESPQSLVDIVLKNPEKAIASRDFCGNC
jgi:hypothetical protein